MTCVHDNKTLPRTSPNYMFCFINTRKKHLKDTSNASFCTFTKIIGAMSAQYPVSMFPSLAPHPRPQGQMGGGQTGLPDNGCQLADSPYQRGRLRDQPNIGRFHAHSAINTYTDTDRRTQRPTDVQFQLRTLTSVFDGTRDNVRVYKLMSVKRCRWWFQSCF